MPNYLPPHVRAALTEGTSASRAYYQWFNLVGDSLSSLSTSVDDVKASVSATQAAAITSITSAGSISVKVSDGVARIGLVGDYVDAGYTRYYGTDPTGARGFFAISDAFIDSANVTKTVDAYGVTTFDLTDLTDSGTGSLLAITRDGKGRVNGTRVATITGTDGQITVANGDASAGLPTINLADVTVTAGGTLKKRAFDAKGRLSQESAATTSDLSEGSNLYYTNARVLVAPLTGLSTATATPITSADTVLSADGKLQAQISLVLNDLIVSSSGKPLVTSAGDFITTSAA